MNMIVAILIFLALILCGASAALLAGGDTHLRRKWFWAGCIAGPLALVAQLLMSPPPPHEALHVTRHRGSHGGIFVSLIIVVVGAGMLFLVGTLGMVELRAHSRFTHQTQYLDRWHEIGDGLLRAASPDSGIVADTFVVRVTREQVYSLRDSIRSESERASRQLQLAATGFRRADGLEGLYLAVRADIEGAKVDARQVALTERERSQHVALLSDRMKAYRLDLAAIDSATATWSGESVPSASQR